jgi:serine protease Do
MAWKSKAVEPPLSEMSDGLVALVEAALPAVVTLSGVTTAMGEVFGSGFIIDSSGHVVTNHHVVDGLGARVSAVLRGGDQIEADLVGSDPVTDLAVVKLRQAPGSFLNVCTNKPRLGQLCIAIGSPLGEFAESVSLGVVSGLDRSLPSLDGRWTQEHMIQTDAAINHGNSGGPLLDMTGNVISVNSSGRDDGQNIGFAVPGETVALVAPELIAHGSMVRCALGVVVSSRIIVDGDRSVRRLAVSSTKGAGPLEIGDALVSLAGRPIQDRGDLFHSLTRSLIGRTTPVEIVRGGVHMTLDVVPHGVSGS